MTIAEMSKKEKQVAGFRRGMGRVGSAFKRPLIDNLMEAFGITTAPGVYKRVNAEIPLTPLEVDFVEKEMAAIGITPDQIWGQ